MVRVILAILAFGITLELCARIDDVIRYGAPFWSNYSYETMFTVDSLGRTGKPNASFRDYHLNSLGFRGPEVRPGGIRIVCIGASETFGLYEDPGREFPRQLQDDLNSLSRTDQFQVVNAGFAGQTIRTAAVRIPQYIEQFHPRYAVIYPTPANYIWLPWIQKSPARQQPPNEKFELRSAEKIRDSMKRFSPPQLLDYLRRREIDRESAAFGKPMDRVSDESVSAFRSDLSEMVDALAEHGVQPVLVTHASRFGSTLSRKDHEELTAWRRFYPMLTENGFLDMEKRMNGAIRALASQKGVPLVDGANAVPPGDEYFGDAIHFTNEGSSLLASSIAKTLLRSANLTNTSYTPATE